MSDFLKLNLGDEGSCQFRSSAITLLGPRSVLRADGVTRVQHTWLRLFGDRGTYVHRGPIGELRDVQPDHAAFVRLPVSADLGGYLWARVHAVAALGPRKAERRNGEVVERSWIQMAGDTEALRVLIELPHDELAVAIMGEHQANEP